MQIPQVPYEDVKVEGVRVEAYGMPSGRPPLVLVHGGTQGSWIWENIAPALAARGWYCACLNWFGHNGSDPLPPSEAVQRSIADVGREIGIVAGWLGREPALVAHSMGGPAATAYASANSVRALVLITPVVPKGHGEEEVPLPVEESAMWSPPPAETSRQIFWDEVDDETSERYYSLVCPESPVAVWEATRWTVEVDTSSITAPAYAFGAGRDMLVPHQYVESLAKAIRADYEFLPGEGHGVPLNPVWEGVADRISTWLDRTLG
jgi:pimeloyl-ACP methyl ester carboxylesterase